MGRDTIRILIDVKHAALPAVEELMNDQSLRNQGVLLTLPELDSRSADPTVLVAIASAAGGALTALITGLLGMARKSKCKSVIIKGSSGRSIEVPCDVPPERVREYARIAKEVDIDSLELSD